MRKRFQRIFTLLLVCALCLSAVPARAAGEASPTGFPDVSKGIWYEQAILLMQNYTPGIIDGIDDPDGVRRFHPDDVVRRGEFLKMLMTAAEGYSIDRSRDRIHWAGKYYTIALENNILVANPFGEQVNGETTPLFPCSYEALQAPITRYEMAVLLNNVCFNMLMEKTVVVKNAAQYVPDYDSIQSTQYATAVEQSYGKGLLVGYEDGSFRGDDSLKRGEAAVVIYRMLWSGKRTMPSWASEPVVSAAPGDRPDGFQSFAEWLRDGHLEYVSGYGQAPDAEGRRLLFGDADKFFFATYAEAEPFMRNISIPCWSVDKTGNKFSTAAVITVHYLVEEEVKLIFQQIYDDPERFPIYGGGVGGGRFTGEKGRHAWGCAIDINPYQNCECNFNPGYFAPTCGYGWWPYGTDVWHGRAISAYQGTLAEADRIYCITPNGSVVKAFADYGWGWLGNGFNSNAEGFNKNFDFMHFSVLPSGG